MDRDESTGRPGLFGSSEVYKLFREFEFVNFRICSFIVRGLKEGVSVNSQPKVRFREYFRYFLMRQKFQKINHSERAENVDFTY